MLERRLLFGVPGVGDLKEDRKSWRAEESVALLTSYLMICEFPHNCRKSSSVGLFLPIWPAAARGIRWAQIEEVAVRTCGILRELRLSA